MATSSPSPLRLLIVDDDDQLRQALVRRFQRLGLAVTEAADAEEALAKADHSRWDVALLDLHLPHAQGEPAHEGELHAAEDEGAAPDPARADRADLGGALHEWRPSASTSPGPARRKVGGAE